MHFSVLCSYLYYGAQSWWARLAGLSTSTVALPTFANNIIDWPMCRVQACGQGFVFLFGGGSTSGSHLQLQQHTAGFAPKKF